MGSNVSATFSAAVQGVGSGTFVLRSAAGAAVPATITYNATTRTATLDPASNLALDTKFTANLVGGGSAIRDVAGNQLASKSWQFTTGSL